MASLKDQVREWRNAFRGQVAWMAVWKEGRGWGVTPLHPNYDETSAGFEWCYKEDRREVRDILKTDPNAVLMNAYYCNLGDVETDTLDDLVNAVKRQYENPCYRLANCDVAEWMNKTETTNTIETEPAAETQTANTIETEPANETSDTADTIEEENEKMPELLNSYTGRTTGLVESPASAKRENSDYSILCIGRPGRVGPGYNGLKLKVSGPLKDYLWHSMHHSADEYDLRKDYYFDEDFNLKFYVVRSEYEDTYNEPVKIVATDRLDEDLRIWGPKDCISDEDTTLPLSKSELTDFCEWLADQQDYTVLF